MEEARVHQAVADSMPLARDIWRSFQAGCDATRLRPEVQLLAGGLTFGDLWLSFGVPKAEAGADGGQGRCHASTLRALKSGHAETGMSAS